MSIQFPVVPSLRGIPPIQSFPGVSQITGSIQGNVLTVTQGVASISTGLSLSGAGIAAGTAIAGPLQAVQDGIGTALVTVQNNVSSIAMQAVGSIGFGTLGDSIGNITSLLSSDASDLLGGLDSATGGSVPQWGIFLNGEPVIKPDSIVAIDFKRDWHIADYPIEDGGFQSYNKVRLPFDARVIMTKAGTLAERAQFLSQLEAAAASLDLYTVVMPEIQYAKANVVHVDYSRKSTNGATMLTVAVWLQEVRVEASSTFTNTASPSAADQVVSGAVQAAQATAGEIQNLLGRVGVGAW